jgi:hypothetical protein
MAPEEAMTGAAGTGEPLKLAKSASLSVAPSKTKTKS